MIGDQETANVADLPMAPEAASKVDAKPVGVFELPDDELLKQLRDWYKEGTSALKETRNRRKKDWRFYSGHQWEKMDQEAYDKAKRPRLTLNMVKSIIAAVVGEERDNRQEMKFYGEGQEDDPAAYAINRIVKWIMDQCGGEFALSSQFKAGAVAGQGWVVPDVDFFEDPNGKIKLLYVSDDEMVPDPLAVDPVHEQGRYLHRVKMMSEDEGEARWPGFKEQVQAARDAAPGGSGPETDGSGFRDIYSTPNDTGSPKLYDATRKLWAVIETWWFQIEPGWIVVDEATGLLTEKTDAEYEATKIQRQNEQQQWVAQMMVPQPAMVRGAVQPPFAAPVAAPHGPVPPAIQGMQRPIKRIYQAFHAFGTLLDKAASPLTKLKRFPYVPFRGVFDPTESEWMGLVRDIIDPQRQHNVEQSIIVQLMQLMPKQSWMAPRGAFHEKVKWQEGVAQPGAMLEYNAARGKPEPIPAQAIPRHLVDMATERPAMMQAISGVNNDLMGMRVAGDAAVSMDMRQKAARTVLAEYFDNFRQTKTVLGKVLLAYIQTYISPGRRIRVLGDEGPTYVQMTKDMTIGDYDLKVDETNSSVNDRIASLNIMQTTLPALAKAGVPIPSSVIDMMPLPPNVRDPWKRMMDWHLTISGQMPPPNWKVGDPLPPPPGAPPPVLAPQGASPPPQPAAAPGQQ